MNHFKKEFNIRGSALEQVKPRGADIGLTWADQKTFARGFAENYHGMCLQKDCPVF